MSVMGTVPVYKAFETATGHDIMIKNTQDRHNIAYTDINSALLNAADPHGIHYGIRHHEGRTYVTEVTSSAGAVDKRGFQSLARPLFVYQYPSSNWDHDLQKDGSVRIGESTRGTFVMETKDTLQYLTDHSSNLVFTTFEDAARLPPNQKLYLETRPSANVPDDFESCTIC